MEDIDKIFRASLTVCLKPWGSKSRLARDAEISLSYVWKLLNGTKYGTDDTRRRIAAALGYSGARYEEFLNIGRQELGFEEETENDQTHLELEKWKDQYYSKVRELETTTAALLKALADAQQRIAELESINQFPPTNNGKEPKTKTVY